MTDHRPVVLVTGAHGFVGRHLAPELATHGWSVRKATRQLRGLENEVAVGEIGPVTCWERALRGVDSIVHLAARVHHPGEENAISLYRDINFAGTVHLARCAVEAGVRHFVYVSTALVNGSSTDGRAPFRETDIPLPRGIYGQTKAEAEAGLKLISENTGLKVTVIRPPLIYGAGALGNFRLLVRATRWGIPLPFAAIKNRRAFLGVQNLVSFLIDRLDRAEGSFDVFLIADDEQISTPDFVRRIAIASGRTASMVPIPSSLLELIFKAGGRPEAYDSVVGSMELDLSKVRATGWQPLLSLDQGLHLALTSGAT